MSEDQDTKSNNIKIAITAVISVLFGAAFIMALILFGMRVQNNIDNKATEKKKADEIITINSVDFDTTDFSYGIPNPDKDQEGNYLQMLIGDKDVSAKSGYYLINSRSKLEDVMNAIRAASGNESISYDVDDNFFNSGSVIAVIREAKKLDKFEVVTVTRDADYNLQIDANEKYDSDAKDEKVGRIVFVKISNIQPKDIEVKVKEEK